MTAAPSTPPGTDPESSCHVAGEILVDLWRDLLSRGLEIALPLWGHSMVPTLLPGDTIHVVACPERPPVGAVVVVLGQPIFAHRVLATGRRKGRELVVTSGDRFPHRADGVNEGSLILGRVVAVTREGTRSDVPAVTPALFPRLKAWWFLATHERGDWVGRSLVWLREVLRGPAKRLLMGTRDLLASARGWPLIGALVRRVWPDLGSRCEVVVADSGPGETAVLATLFAVWRGAVVGRLSLGVASWGPDDPGRLWIDGVHTSRRTRRRGISSRLHREAMRKAREMGYREVAALVAVTNRPERRLLEGLGFREITSGPLADGVRTLNAQYPDSVPFCVMLADLGDESGSPSSPA